MPNTHTIDDVDRDGNLLRVCVPPYWTHERILSAANARWQMPKPGRWVMTEKQILPEYMQGRQCQNYCTPNRVHWNLEWVAKDNSGA